MHNNGEALQMIMLQRIIRKLFGLFGNTKNFEDAEARSGVYQASPFMTFQEFDRKFKKRVIRLPYKKQLDLAIDICKKLFADYREFSETNQWGDPELLLAAIDLIERSKFQRTDKKEISGMMEKLEEIIPDTDDFGAADCALNACSAIYYTLDFLISKDGEQIYFVGRCLYETVDSKIQEDDELTEAEIDRNGLMISTRNYLLQMTL